MAKVVEEISDGLEIISIGKLYSGPWEKKYWSCSRGKDRYPYPVGFKAVRTQNGITYRMEIFEGHKGPLFTISATDGVSSSGQTPDIAWDGFQKKGSSQIKLLRGKRFSCKIDGLEFFGFKNAFVQRLLRTLVANVDGPAEKELKQTVSGHEASEDPVQQTELIISSDLLPHKENSRVPWKRSRKGNIIKGYSGSLTSLKEVRSQHENHSAGTLKHGLSCQGIQGNCDLKNSTSTEYDDFVECAGAGKLSEKLQPEIEQERELVSTKNEDLFNSSNKLVLESISGPEERKFSSCGGSSALEKLNSTKQIENFDCSVARVENEGMAAKSNIEATHESELCAPDTFDHPIEDEGMVVKGKIEATDESEPCAPDTFDHPVEDEGMAVKSKIEATDQSELCALDTFDHLQGEAGVTNMDVSKALVTETQQENDACTSNSYPSSEKQDSDSADQEVAKSMMTFLLPRAIPLLKTFQRRKKKNKKPLKNSTIVSIEENNMINHVSSSGRGMKESLNLSESDKEHLACDVLYEDMEQLEPVVRHGFDNNGNQNPQEKRNPLFHDVQLVHQSLVVPDTYQSETFLETQSGPPVCPINGTHGSSYPADSCIINSEGYAMKELPDDQNLADFDMSTLPPQIHRIYDEMVHKKAGDYGPRLNNHISTKKKIELQSALKLVACYDHPMPVSMVLLSTVGNIIYLCVVCSSALQGDKMLFNYKATISGEDIGSPSFVGYSPAVFPSSIDAFGRLISVDSSGLQFTPSAQSLVLLNSIKVACCREGSICCTCPACSSCCFQQNGVKIVRVEVGYVSLVLRLKTTQPVRCILVCKPNYLVAADESGQLYLWVMNSSWSVQIDECYLPVPDVMIPCMVELQKLPNSDALVVGHNGNGMFNLWDINRRILMSKFSIPSTCVAKCIPISLFKCQEEDSLSADLKPEDFVNKMLDATKIWSPGSGKSNIPPTIGNDVAIWVLVSTVSDYEFQDHHQSVDGQINPVQCWRLALLFKEMVILGTSLGDSATAIGASDSHGIMGTKDGFVYLWELSTGTKVGMLHQFKGTGVSCIANESCNGTLAIASDSGQLLVYKPT